MLCWVAWAYPPVIAEHLKNAHRVLEKAATTSSISVQLATEICLLKKYIYKSRSLKSEKFMQSFKQVGVQTEVHLVKM